MIHVYKKQMRSTNNTIDGFRIHLSEPPDFAMAEAEGPASYDARSSSDTLLGAEERLVYGLVLKTK